MSILSLIKGKNKNNNSFFVLDIGDFSVKCLIVKSDTGREHVNIVGYASEEINPGDVFQGQIVNIHPVVEKTAIAIDKAVYQSGFKPEYIIAGINGTQVVNQTNEIIHTRKNPKQKISSSELSEILNASQQQIKKDILQQGKYSTEIELINASVLETKIDDVAIKNPLDFIGQNIIFKLFSSFAPSIQINALQTVADNLKLNLITTVYQPFAYFKTLKNIHECIVIDIGENLTSILIVKNNEIVESHTLPIGSSKFTRKLADNLEVNVIKANQYKIDYANDFLSADTTRAILTLFSQPISKFNQKILNHIRKIIVKGYPTKILFTGGGSLLPGIIENFTNEYHKINKKDNQIGIIDINYFDDLIDQTNCIQDTSAMPAIAIAKLGTQFGDYDNTISNFIKKLYQTLRN